MRFDPCNPCCCKPRFQFNAGSCQGIPSPLNGPYYPAIDVSRMEVLRGDEVLFAADDPPTNNLGSFVTTFVPASSQIPRGTTLTFRTTGTTSRGVAFVQDRPYVVGDCPEGVLVFNNIAKVGPYTCCNAYTRPYVMYPATPVRHFWLKGDAVHRLEVDFGAVFRDLPEGTVETTESGVDPPPPYGPGWQGYSTLLGAVYQWYDYRREEVTYHQSRRSDSWDFVPSLDTSTPPPGQANLGVIRRVFTPEDKTVVTRMKRTANSFNPFTGTWTYGTVEYDTTTTTRSTTHYTYYLSSCLETYWSARGIGPATPFGGVGPGQPGWMGVGSQLVLKSMPDELTRLELEYGWNPAGFMSPIRIRELG